MLVLKVTDNDRKAHGGFEWPASGHVECSDWNPKPVCGGWLHGWANGCGTYRHDSNEGQWLVVDVPDDTVVQLGKEEKVKFPRGYVVYCGTREGAVSYLIKHKALTKDSNPALACFTPRQLMDLAMRCADRAVRLYAPTRLRACGILRAAKLLEDLPRLVDQRSAQAAVQTADKVEAWEAGYIAYTAANAAVHVMAADSVSNVERYATNVVDNASELGGEVEYETHRIDKLKILGLV